jgi:DNA excision repair protein ERCC-3
MRGGVESLLQSSAVIQPTNPLIVQSDRSLLLEVHNPLFEPARMALSPFAELEKSPEHVHSYRITPLSLWNAAAAGVSAASMAATLMRFAKYPVPENVLADIRDLAARWGRVRLLRSDGNLVLASDDEALLVELARHSAVKPYLGPAAGVGTAGPLADGSLRAAESDTLPGDRIPNHRIVVPIRYRGLLKQALTNIGWPVEDLAGYQTGGALDLTLRLDAFRVRDYQTEAADAFYAGGSARGGSGVIVLPCGAGKTIVGLVAMAHVRQCTLIITTSRTSAQQWRRELVEKTTLQPEQIVEYSGQGGDMGGVTLTTYQMLTYRPNKTDSFPHLGVFDAQDWGLIIYDEVHTLPAPVFRATAEIQARRRLGLTATLVREDGREADVFSLIGPKKYDVPWRDLENRGWIAEAACTEVRCQLLRDERWRYATAAPREKFRIASESSVKLALTQRVLALHPNAPTLIIGQYIEQLERIAATLGAPLVTGKTAQRERDALYGRCRTGEQRLLVLSKVGNFALDLPDAEVLVQVSGTFGSRQEEAQRLGRVLRPKRGRPAHFYTLVSRETEEETFAHHRQLFLTEQGYAYRIVDEEEL